MHRTPCTLCTDPYMLRTCLFLLLGLPHFALPSVTCLVFLWRQVNIGPLYRARPGDTLATLSKAFGAPVPVLVVSGEGREGEGGRGRRKA